MAKRAKSAGPGLFGADDDDIQPGAYGTATNTCPLPFVVPAPPSPPAEPASERVTRVRLREIAAEVLAERQDAWVMRLEHAMRIAIGMLDTEGGGCASGATWEGTAATVVGILKTALGD